MLADWCPFYVAGLPMRRDLAFPPVGGGSMELRWRQPSVWSCCDRLWIKLSIIKELSLLLLTLFRWVFIMICTAF